MAGVNNNLYPPIMNKTYMPAFIYTEGCRIYFSISIYNSLNEMHHPVGDLNTVDAVQIVVQNQKNNQSALNKTIYPSGVKLTTLGIDNTRQGNDKYYVDITYKDMQDGFKLNEYYKVQIRFTAAGAPTPPGTGQGIDGWLGSNLAYFSEWSTVVLIRGISMPELSLKDFDNSVDEITFTLTDIKISGKVLFENGDSQILKSYRIKLYNNLGVLLQDSNNILVDPYNGSRQINYELKYDLDTNTDYILKVQILTNNLYSWPEQKKYKFSIDEILPIDFDVNIAAIPDEQEGRVIIHITSDSPLSSINENFIIRRTSNKTNFKIWDTVYYASTNDPLAPLDFTWYDYTIEPGIWYKYCTQRYNNLGFKSNVIAIENPIIVVPEDMFLAAEGKQLKIRFNPQINNFNHTISQAKTETIGSKYPFIRRNGNINYKTFSINGLITHFMDIRSNRMFASKQDLYQDTYNLYQNYNTQNKITLFNDYIYEREFREQVIDFLYKNNVKLFKSTTEGNVLVKLMDISLTPDNTLGRLVYSFSCTAHQICDSQDFNNYIKYNIQDLGEFGTSTSYTFEKYGQLAYPNKSVYYQETGNNYETRSYKETYQRSFGTDDLIKNTLKTKYQKIVTEEYEISIQSLKYLKIELTNKPYLIGINVKGQPYKISDRTSGTSAQTSGHIVKINGQLIIIGKDGIYELTDDNTKITSLSFPYAGQQGTISYIAVLSQSENSNGTIPKDYSSLERIGQYWGFFNIEDSVYRKIINKYNQSFYLGESSNAVLYDLQVQKIRGIRIYANPGTVFYLRESQDTDLQRHVIGLTGMLEFYDQDTDVQGLYFSGIHLTEAADNNNIDYDTEYYDTKITIRNFEEVIDPIRNGVYYLAPNSDENIDQLYNSIREKVTSSAVSDEEYQLLKNLADIAVQNSNENKITTTAAVQNWLNNTGYLNDLTQSNINNLVNILYSLILIKYISMTNKFIYYDYQWYPFTDNGDIATKTVQAIVDYYCDILKRRF